MPERDQTTHKEQAVEVAVFLFLIVPSMLLSLFVVRRGNLSFLMAAVATIALSWRRCWEGGEE